MSRKFYAINRRTGERWKPKTENNSDSSVEHQYLVMYDSGYVAVVSHNFYTHIEPLDTKVWKVINKMET